MYCITFIPCSWCSTWYPLLLLYIYKSVILAQVDIIVDLIRDDDDDKKVKILYFDRYRKKRVCQ